MSSIDEDRRRRLRDIEVNIQDPRSIMNVDCLIDSNIKTLLFLLNFAKFDVI